MMQLHLSGGHDISGIGRVRDIEIVVERDIMGFVGEVMGQPYHHGLRQSTVRFVALEVSDPLSSLMEMGKHFEIDEVLADASGGGISVRAAFYVTHAERESGGWRVDGIVIDEVEIKECDHVGAVIKKRVREIRAKAG